MTKKSKCRIVFWSVTGVVSLTVFVALSVFWGLSHPFGIYENPYLESYFDTGGSEFVSDILDDLEEQYDSLLLIKQDTITDPVQSLVIDFNYALVKVAKSEDGSIQIKEKASWDVSEKNQFKIDVTDGCMTLIDQNYKEGEGSSSTQNGRLVSSRGATKPVVFELFLPEQLWDRVDLRFTSGDMTWSGLEATSLKIHNDGFNTLAVSGSFQEIYIPQSMGGLSLDSSTPAALTAGSLFDKCKITGFYTTIDVDTCYDDLSIETNSQAKLRIGSTHGTVTAHGPFTSIVLKNNFGKIRVWSSIVPSYADYPDQGENQDVQVLYPPFS